MPISELTISFTHQFSNQMHVIDVFFSVHVRVYIIVVREILSFDLRLIHYLCNKYIKHHTVCVVL